MTIEVSTTDKRDGMALALFARWHDWQQGKTKDGRSFFAIPGSELGLVHMADRNDSSCPDRRRSRNVGKHVRAVRLWMAAYQTGAVTLKPRPTTPAVVDDAGIGDDLVVLMPKGAAYLAEMAKEPDAATRPRMSGYTPSASRRAARTTPSRASGSPTGISSWMRSEPTARAILTAGGANCRSVIRQFWDHASIEIDVWWALGVRSAPATRSGR